MEKKEQKRLDRLNEKSTWGFTKKQLLTLVTKHEIARKNNDTKTMEGIEYRFLKFEYDTWCEQLKQGLYSEIRYLFR